MVPEIRTKTVTYTVCKPVYETKTCDYQVRVPAYKDVEQTYTCRVPVYNLVDKTYTVMVPTTETRTGTRKVCKVVQATEMRTVTVDEGHYETQMVEVPCATVAVVPACWPVAVLRRCGGCGGCDACTKHDCGGCSNDCGGDCGGCGDAGCGECAPKTTTVCQKVWVPNVRDQGSPRDRLQAGGRRAAVRVHRDGVQARDPHVPGPRLQLRDADARPARSRSAIGQTETRTRTYQTCKMVPEQVTKEVQYTVCVPKTETRDADRDRLQDGALREGSHATPSACRTKSRRKWTYASARWSRRPSPCRPATAVAPTMAAARMTALDPPLQPAATDVPLQGACAGLPVRRPLPACCDVRLASASDRSTQ